MKTKRKAGKYLCEVTLTLYGFVDTYSEGDSAIMNFEEAVTDLLDNAQGWAKRDVFSVPSIELLASKETLISRKDK